LEGSIEVFFLARAVNLSHLSSVLSINRSFFFPLPPDLFYRAVIQVAVPHHGLRTDTAVYGSLSMETEKGCAGR